MFECEVCSMKFARKYDLNRHMTIVHKGIKDFRKNCYACAICEKIFKNISNYRRHIRIVHDEERKYKCLICESRFSENSILKRHIVLVHEEKQKRTSNAWSAIRCLDTNKVWLTITQKHMEWRDNINAHFVIEDFLGETVWKNISQKSICQKFNLHTSNDLQ